MKGLLNSLALIAVVLPLAAAIQACGPKSTEDNDAKAATALARRVMGDKARKIVFRKAERPDEVSSSDRAGLDGRSRDYFRFSSKGGKIVIEGNNANSMAVGLNNYLKHFCKVEFGWLRAPSNSIRRGDKTGFPSSLPRVKKPVTGEAKVSNRFFLNYCTFGYTMPWWQWADWEHFIDWMALNGINLPLAITGQESIWFKIWTELGIPEDQVRAYFTGPAHLPWHRMQNIDRWGGPLPQCWLDGQLELQKQITARERELGMRPVLPAFAGHVPAELANIYPEANISKLSNWAGFPEECVCSFLDPLDPLYAQIQKKFVQLESDIYGTDHIYGIDIFNELTPPSWEPEYLAHVSRHVDETLVAADPKAVWLQMGWLFYYDRRWTPERVNAYLTSFPSERQLILDYYCERREIWRLTDKFFGVPYIWCYLGNFGGNTALVGNMHKVNELIDKTFEEGGSNFAGLGSTLEGFDCNPFMYEFIFEKAWMVDGKEINVNDYVKTLADQRIGRKSVEGREAWKILIDSVYVSNSGSGHSPWVSCRPNIGKSRGRYTNSKYFYKDENLVKALDLLLKAHGHNNAYEFDVVNLTRQMVSNYFGKLKVKFDDAFKAKDRALMESTSAEMLTVLDDLDRLLATQSYFMVGKWISDARSWGSTEEEKNYFESNARNLITTWGDADQSLNDYASRSLNGLVESFYTTRWKIFFEAVFGALNSGAEWDEERYKAYNDEVTAFEKEWWVNRKGNFQDEPEGNSYAVSSRLFEKYAPKMTE